MVFVARNENFEGRAERPLLERLPHLLSGTTFFRSSLAPCREEGEEALNGHKPT